MKLINIYESLIKSITPGLFHCSMHKNLDNILKFGLNPRHNKRYIGISSNEIYLWEYKELAMWYALTEARDYNTQFDIFEINQSVKTVPDLTIGVDYAVSTMEVIKPENIKLVETVSSTDERIQQFGDVEYILDMIADDDDDDDDDDDL